jgi:hypothetical protein
MAVFVFFFFFFGGVLPSLCNIQHVLPQFFHLFFFKKKRKKKNSFLLSINALPGFLELYIIHNPII